jgi:hypothetical protein
MANNTISTKRLCELTGLGPDRIKQLQEAGIIAKTARATWPAIETLSKLVLFYRSEARRGHRSAADSEWRKIKAQELQLRVAERAHKLIETDESITAMQDVLGVILTGLSGMLVRVAGKDLGLRRKIDAEIFTMREAAARRLKEQAQALRTTGEATDAPATFGLAPPANGSTSAP